MKSTLSRGLEIMLWSGVMQLILLAAFLAGWMLQGPTAPQSGVGANVLHAWPEQVNVSYAALAADAISAHQDGKGDLDIPPEDPEDPEDIAARAIAGKDAPDDAEAEAFLDETGPEGTGAQSMSPLLRMNRKSGKLEIGSFETSSLTSEPGQCLELGYTLLDDAGAPEDALIVLAESEAITMARICASNGSVVITCRMNKMTISPRRLKPNESCTG